MPIIYRTAQQIIDIATDLVSVRLMIAACQNALLDTGLSGTKKYSWDAGMGRMEEIFMSAQELMDTLQRLTATRDRLQRMTDGTTNQSVRFVRSSC